ncbi:pimeloyl-ACP methyl ester carboxylesterase [Chelatococcus asaccharovorans]|uniref:Pimeloyl-ACP methyl ester carboxylesterase n=1 Tax=Chelatococcus asaccharovorans TaxID=28210 RepID=A0A2V3UAN8_9HYPH|nr:pimeloyl-ACP methyl ester carboxylesterase [Chelatococcus asaccharovorans]
MMPATARAEGGARPAWVRVHSPDGTDIAAAFSGAPVADGIVFIHGILQAGLCWKYQMADASLGRWRLAAYDLRGHGFSSKPVGREPYHDGTRWADDLLAVMDAAGIGRAVLVGWSYGGRVMLDFLDRHLALGRVAGLAFVDANTKNAPGHTGAIGGGLLREAASDDIAEAIAGRLGFVDACFENKPSAADLHEIIAYNMLVPPQTMRDLMGRPLERDALMASLDLPTLVIQGERDALCLPLSAEHTARSIPGARLSIYEGIGHAPFLETPERFNAELAAFADACFAAAPLVPAIRKA